MTENKSLIYRALGRLDILAEYVTEGCANNLIVQTIELLERAVGKDENR